MPWLRACVVLTLLGVAVTGIPEAGALKPSLRRRDFKGSPELYSQRAGHDQPHPISTSANQRATGTGKAKEQSQTRALKKTEKQNGTPSYAYPHSSKTNTRGISQPHKAGTPQYTGVATPDWLDRNRYPDSKNLSPRWQQHTVGKFDTHPDWVDTQGFIWKHTLEVLEADERRRMLGINQQAGERNTEQPPANNPT